MLRQLFFYFGGFNLAPFLDSPAGFRRFLLRLRTGFACRRGQRSPARISARATLCGPNLRDPELARVSRSGRAFSTGCGAVRPFWRFPQPF